MVMMILMIKMVMNWVNYKENESVRQKKLEIWKENGVQESEKEKLEKKNRRMEKNKGEREGDSKRWRYYQEISIMTYSV